MAGFGIKERSPFYYNKRKKSKFIVAELKQFDFFDKSGAGRFFSNFIVEKIFISNKV